MRGTTTRELAIAAAQGLEGLEPRIRERHPIDLRHGTESVELLAAGGEPKAELVLRETGELFVAVELWTEDPALSERIRRELEPILG